MGPSPLLIRGLTVVYHRKPVLWDVTCVASGGLLTLAVLLGPQHGMLGRVLGQRRLHAAMLSQSGNSHRE
ncbi:hypothetical protein [Azospirillum sp. sgz301742]